MKHKCEGSMYPQGGAFDKPRRGVKVRCPYCHKEYGPSRMFFLGLRKGLLILFVAFDAGKHVYS